MEVAFSICFAPPVAELLRLTLTPRSVEAVVVDFVVVVVTAEVFVRDGFECTAALLDEFVLDPRPGFKADRLLWAASLSILGCVRRGNVQ